MARPRGAVILQSPLLLWDCHNDVAGMQFGSLHLTSYPFGHTGHPDWTLDEAWPLPGTTFRLNQSVQDGAVVDQALVIGAANRGILQPLGFLGPFHGQT
jgi:hypothetical protein